MVELSIRPEAEVVEIDAAPSPKPTEPPIIVSVTAVDVLVDGKKVMTLPTREEAETVLTTYLNRSIENVPEEENLTEATFGCEIYIVETDGETSQISYSDAFSMLWNDRTIVPVKIVTEQRTVLTGEVATETGEEPALGKGSRLFCQLGTGGKNVITTRRTYTGDRTETEESGPVAEFAAHQTVVHNGTYESERPDKEPDKKQGVTGKEAEGFSIRLPMQITITGYFGTRHNIMHNGIDQKTKEGNEILAPAEGVVTYVGKRGEMGIVIDIDHGNGFVSRLTHCKDVQVERNQRVFKGDVVAYLAAMENSEEPTHLHYELLIDGIPYNPLFYYQRG